MKIEQGCLVYPRTNNVGQGLDLIKWVFAIF